MFTFNETVAASASLFQTSGAIIPTPGSERQQQNPFLADLVIETRTRSTGELLQSEAVYDEQGETVETRHYLTKHVDRAEFVKVLSRSYRDLFNLRAAGSRVFWYLAEMVQHAPGRDQIYLYWREVIEFQGETKNGEGRGNAKISKTAFYEGLKQLEAAGFVARQSRPHWYWLNPRRLWNGSRVSFVNTLDASELGHLDPARRPKVVKPQPKQANKQERTRGARRRAAAGVALFA